MSDAEYECLIAGGKLLNDTHHAELGRRTTSVGFCFFPEEPDEAIHWLRGIVSTDRCVTLDIPEHLLTESHGTFRDPDRDRYEEGMGLLAAIFMPCVTMEKTEYCLTDYSLRSVRLVDATDKFAEPKFKKIRL